MSILTNAINAMNQLANGTKYQLKVSMHFLCLFLSSLSRPVLQKLLLLSPIVFHFYSRTRQITFSEAEHAMYRTNVDTSFSTILLANQ